MLRALIWDVDGTLAETERDGHRLAFNRAFEDAGLPWRWDVDVYGELLTIAGGLERLRHDLSRRAAAPSSPVPSSIGAQADLAERLHRAKNRHYAAIVEAGGIGLRPGVRRLMDACAAEDVRQAIATTTSAANVDALLRPALGPRWSDRFAAVVCSEQAPVKKPDPSVYRLALGLLDLDAGEAFAIEDSPNGLAAARGAGLSTLVTRGRYLRDGDFGGAVAICDGLDTPVTWAGGVAERVDLPLLQRWCMAGRAGPPPKVGDARSA